MPRPPKPKMSEQDRDVRERFQQVHVPRSKNRADGYKSCWQCRTCGWRSDGMAYPTHSHDPETPEAKPPVVDTAAVADASAQVTTEVDSLDSESDR